MFFSRADLTFASFLSLPFYLYFFFTLHSKTLLFLPMILLSFIHFTPCLHNKFLSASLSLLFSLSVALSVWSLCPGLIIHEGSSVYRIFKRWQAVNQQWKVLNYEKAKDLGDPISSSSEGGWRGGRNTPHSASGAERGGRAGQRGMTNPNHHCGYSIIPISS